MEITWHGDICFTIKEKAVSVVLSPNKEAGKLKGSIVMNSYGEVPEVEVEGMERSFDWPGEYEMKDVPIVAMQAENGSGEQTIIFCFEVSGIKFCHLGELGHVPSNEMFKEIGDVDVLMIKVGEGSNLDSKKTMEVIEGIEPKVVIPMGADLSETVLKSLGADKIEALDKFEIKSNSDLPADQMRYVVLNKA